MSAKTIFLLGMVIVTLFVYLCIDSKKDEYYVELVENKEELASIEPKILNEEVSIPLSIKKTLKDASFAYVSGTKNKIAGIFSQEDNSSDILLWIEEVCQNEACIKDIKFIDDIAPYDFSKETLGLIKSAKEEAIKNFALYINRKTLKIEGQLKDKQEKERLKPFLESFIRAGYTIEDEMIIIVVTPVKKDILIEKTKKREERRKIIKEVIVEAPRDVFITPQHLSIDEAEESISKILSDNAIRFDYRSSGITKQSKATLNNVIDILLGLDDIMILVAGYTDSTGDTIYNKVLSQKRADTVRRYLIKSGVRAKLIKSKGYGEENPIATPEDSINRRVEIHLTQGK